SMLRKSVQRFCDNDMRKNKDLKREERIRKIATRFRRYDKGIIPWETRNARCNHEKVPPPSLQAPTSVDGR
ncbi:hypothetical protein, partial [Rhizobium leguminosarum]|uniref:hypothetical protein n=1 Tax=Rhizobium leguminosarum TaxID=384 RepID=UPI003F9C40B3